MNTLLLEGSNKDDEFSQMLCSIFTDELQKYDNSIKVLKLRDIEIASCLGCFGCWIKTPGVCVINDAGRDLAKDVIQSDLVISISPVTFGGYSYHLKKAFDRLIPNISPYFKMIKGEVHHKARYKHHPNIISVGTLVEYKPDLIKTFENLVIRNAINMHNSLYLSRIFYQSQSLLELRKEAFAVLKEAGAVNEP